MHSTYRQNEVDLRPRFEDARASARRAIEAFHSVRGGLAAPVPVRELARWLGYSVVELYAVPDEFSALVSIRDKLIGVNGKHHPHRQRFSVCHEIGHILLNHPPESRCTSKEVKVFNAEADVCAGELLMPEALLTPLLQRQLDVKELITRFDVSREALLRRLGGASSSYPVQQRK